MWTAVHLRSPHPVLPPPSLPPSLPPGLLDTGQVLFVCDRQSLWAVNFSMVQFYSQVILGICHNAWQLWKQNKYLLNWVKIKASTECASCIPGRPQPDNRARRTRRPGGDAELMRQNEAHTGLQWFRQSPEKLSASSSMSPWPALFFSAFFCLISSFLSLNSSKVFI